MRTVRFSSSGWAHPSPDTDPPPPDAEPSPWMQNLLLADPSEADPPRSCEQNDRQA